MMEALKKQPNSCAEIVGNQFKSAALRHKSELHLPEPWTGIEPTLIPEVQGERRIPLLFLVEAGRLCPGERNVPTLSHDLPSYESFYTRRFADRLGRFILPGEDQSLTTFGTVTIRRRSGDGALVYSKPEGAAQDKHHVHELWTLLSAVTRSILNRSALETLGYDDPEGILGKHSIILPLVHCKTDMEGTGVRNAAAPCFEMHTRRFLEYFRPRLVVITGKETLDQLLTADISSGLPRESLVRLQDESEAFSWEFANGAATKVAYFQTPAAHAPLDDFTESGAVISPAAADSLRHVVCSRANPQTGYKTTEGAHRTPQHEGGS